MYTILYVDDEEALLEIGSRFLERDGTMLVRTLISARDALAELESGQFDAIISDYMMPDMDGIEFLKSVRSRYPKLPFILFTGRGRETVVIQAINHGADFYLQKGGDPSSQFAELAHKVRMAIERRRAEKALGHEILFNQAIFDSVPGILYLYDAEGRLVRWNRNHETVTGYSAEELAGRYVLDWFPDEHDKKVIQEGIETALREGHATGQARIQTRSGERIPFFFTARRLEIEGKIYFTGIGVDITERQKAEEALHASEEKFRGISERSSDLIYVEDEGGQITYVSPSVTRILGYTPEEVIGKQGDLFVAEEDRQKIRDGRISKQEGDAFENFIIHVRRKDGALAELDLQAIPILRNGAFLGLQVIGREVTGRRKAEQAIRESEEQYRVLIEHIQDGAFLEQDGRVILCNRVLADMVGYSPEEMVGKPFMQFIAPEDIPRIMEQYTRWVKGEELRDTYELSTLHRDGKTQKEVVLSIGPGIYHNRPASIGTVRDVTRARHQEQVLRESEKLYRTLADSLPNYVVVHRGGSILYANRLASETTGIPQEDLIGKSIFDFIAPESRDLVMEKIRERETGISTGWYEVKVPVRGGEMRTALVHSTTIPYKGSPAVLLVMSDITPHTQMEASLRESEERFRAFTENSLDTIMLFDRELRHLYVNPIIIKGFGIPPAEYIGKTHREMGFPDHLVRLWEDSLREVFRSGKPGEVELQLPSGVWADWLLVPIHGQDGSVIQVLASARVITKKKLVEETLRRTNRQLNLLNAVTRHDILNQVTVIMANLDHAESEHPAPGMERFYQALRSAAELIRSQIEFTRVYEDIGSQEPCWQDVPAVLARQPVPEGVTLVQDLGYVEIFADPMLEKVFYNLIDNSARHGGNPVEIHVTGGEEPDGYRILFTDNGKGIPGKEKEKIFVRGFGKNTGLGLFLVREILSITGITIRENGVEGRGARFEILVPPGAYRFGERLT